MLLFYDDSCFVKQVAEYLFVIFLKKTNFLLLPEIIEV